MKNTELRSRGFTLIAALLMLVLMSGLAIGLLLMVNTEQRAGSYDVENSLAYRGAEAGIEQMASSIATQFSQIQAPTAADISALNITQPVVPGITFPSGMFRIIPHTNADGTLQTAYQQINGGPNAGLYAQLIGVDLDVTAQRPLGEQVRMLRTVEVALIPVFQFGAFSDSDLSLFNSPDLDFRGRVHTNGDLYLGVSNGSDLIFHDKVTAFGNVIRMTYPNGSPVASNDGDVKIPTTSGGCDGASPPVSSCRPMSVSSGIYREGSLRGGVPSANNTNWPTISNTTYHSWIMDGNYGNGNAGTTPVKLLALPFVSGNALPFEIIRRPPKFGQPATGADPSRLAMLAQIRVLLSDNPADLHLIDWNGVPAQDIHLDGTDPLYGAAGVPVPGVGANTFFATAANTVSGAPKTDANFVQPWGVANNTWPLIGGWLLVEAKWSADDKWHGVTQEWLQRGFARGLYPPASAYTAVGSAYANSPIVHPNAILTFQMLADRNGNGDTADANESNIVGTANGQYNWFPINFYDAREGEARDWTGATMPPASSCSVNGVMNAIELDVYNLRRWLTDAAGTGPNVDSVTQNGYILYFSDRRGEGDAATGILPQGEFGFEDVINNASGNAATPDGDSETRVTIRTPSGLLPYSPEDTDLSGVVETYGGKNVGDGFGLHAAVVAGANPNPLTTRIPNCFTTGRKNRVTGARHALKLVDGSGQNRLPMPGFTVAAENPVYIQGNYNSDSLDGTWNNTPSEPNPLTHAAAAVIADTTTLLSNNWLDTGVVGAAARRGSLLYPFDATTGSGNRPSVTTYYRTAIAAGKTMNFPHPGYTTSTAYFGTDGGLHNFLRFLENWNGDTLNYKGSLVSLFYSNYATGTFKCCNYMVYQPPVRNYRFDQLFSDPKNLPPGTPMFKDVNNLTYRQDFTPQ